MKPRGIPSLTGIRGVAAVWVMLFHLQNDAGKYFHLPGLENIRLLVEGFRGVDLFFILSGFILMFAHERDFLQIRKERLIRFAKLRFMRVYPLNTVVLILIAIFLAFNWNILLWTRATHDPHDYTLIPFIKTLLLVNHWYLPGAGNWNTPTWSLSLELLGYLAFPYLAHYLVRVQRARTAICLALACYMLYVLALVSAHDVYKNAIATVAIARMFFAFVLGMVIYRLWIITEKTAEKLAVWIGVACLLVIFSVVLVPQAAVLMDLAFGFLIYSLTFQKGWINAFLASPPIMFLGKISFPLYLAHGIPLNWIHYFGLQHSDSWSFTEKVLILTAWGVVAVLLSTVLHYFVERPFHELGRRWANKSNVPARMSAPVSS